MSDETNKLEPGICVKIQGLQRAPQLNGKYGTLIRFHREGPNAGRWGVRCDEDARAVAVKPGHLRLAVEDKPPVPTNLPHLIDKWDSLTDTSEILDEGTSKVCRRMSANAETMEQAEQDIYTYINDGHKNYDAMHFPDLFLFGRGSFAQMNVRFEKYVSWLLRQHHGNALQHDGWIAFVTNRAAVLRKVMKRPPLWQTDTVDQTLTQQEVDALKLLNKIDEKKAFCFRYLLGDLEASQVAQLYLHDRLQQLQSRSKTNMQRIDDGT